MARRQFPPVQVVISKCGLQIAAAEYWGAYLQGMRDGKRPGELMRMSYPFSAIEKKCNAGAGMTHPEAHGSPQDSGDLHSAPCSATDFWSNLGQVTRSLSLGLLALPYLRGML